MLRMNVKMKTVEVMDEYVSLQGTRAPSQGSMQALESGDVFVGWGHSAAFSEFDGDGMLLCESHFGAGWFDWMGRVMSYRAFKTRKGEWVGRPQGKPDVRLEGERIHVSWNGATEVRRWSLEGTRESELQWLEIDILKREAFEESFVLSSTDVGGYERYRVAALDENGQILSYSDEVEHDLIGSLFNVWVTGLIWSGCFFGACILWKLRRRKWRRAAIRLKISGNIEPDVHEERGRAKGKTCGSALWSRVF
jgi:hypothetical protein